MLSKTKHDKNKFKKLQNSYMSYFFISILDYRTFSQFLSYHIYKAISNVNVFLFLGRVEKNYFYFILIIWNFMILFWYSIIILVIIKLIVRLCVVLNLTFITQFSKVFSKFILAGYNKY